jgi:hypothetical protein
MFRSARFALLTSSVLSIACGVLSATAHADVYKYKDEKGNVAYTDKPMFLPAERISIKTENSNIVDLDDRDESAAPERKPDAPTTSDKKKSTQSETAGKAELCNKARQDYLARMNAQRLYEDQPNGEKRYLSQKELEAARASAKQAMDTICN